MRRQTPMEFEVPRSGEFKLVDADNGNERLACVKFNSHVDHVASATFESLMDFQFFESALESHGFARVESEAERRFRLGQR
ncbi:MAG TPA: hypothetical protein VJI33_05150 [Candidatus Paceibacterota bacterium]